MLLTAPVRPAWRAVIPAVVHKDHSARIQTVTKEANPLYYDLLTLFNLRSWHASYYRDYDAYLKTLDRHIRLVIFNPEVVTPLVSTSVKAE